MPAEEYWKQAIRLNNHAVFLMQTGVNDRAAIFSLQRALNLQKKYIRDIAQHQVQNPGARSSSISNLARLEKASRLHSSRTIRRFQDADFFLFDQAFLMREDLSMPDGESRSKTAFVETQSAVILFNLALVFHRHGHSGRQLRKCRREQKWCNSKRENDEDKLLLSKSKILYGMAGKLIGSMGPSSLGYEDAVSQELFAGTTFALRLGIANNVAHVEAILDSRNNNHDLEPKPDLQSVARLMADDASRQSSGAKHIPFAVLSGILMNVSSRSPFGCSERFAPAA